VADPRRLATRPGKGMDGNKAKRGQGIFDATNSGEDVADADHTGRRRGTERRQSGDGEFELHGEERPADRPEDHWQFEPDVGRLVNGLPNRVSQLRALGNSIVPQIAQEIGQAIRIAHDG
jgi:hypothetical protein